VLVARMIEASISCSDCDDFAAKAANIRSQTPSHQAASFDGGQTCGPATTDVCALLGAGTPY
jgi:hypothetical protein